MSQIRGYGCPPLPGTQYPKDHVFKHEMDKPNVPKNVMKNRVDATMNQAASVTANMGKSIVTIR